MTDGARAVLLTGRLGVGKTALAQETYAALAEAGRPVAALDLDWLAWARPEAGSGETTSSLLAGVLQALRPVYERAGIRFYVLARALAGAHDVAPVREALGLPLVVVRVTCPDALAEARIRARDVGAEREENLRELRRFDGPVGEDFAIENGERPIRAVATELLDRLGWTTMRA